MSRYARQPGVRVELLERNWVAFSPVSGDTLVLNDESATVLELIDHGDEATIAAMIAHDTGLPVDQVKDTLAGVWGQLLDAGLIAPRAAPLAIAPDVPT